MKWPCIIDAVVLTAFVVACIWEWRRDVNAKAHAELKELMLPKAKVVNPYRDSMKDRCGGQSSE